MWSGLEMNHNGIMYAVDKKTSHTIIPWVSGAARIPQMSLLLKIVMTYHQRPAEKSARSSRSVGDAAEYGDQPVALGGGFGITTGPVVCGMGPEARALYSGQEAVSRISIVQRTLLIAEYLLKGGKW